MRHANICMWFCSGCRCHMTAPKKEVGNATFRLAMLQHSYTLLNHCSAAQSTSRLLTMLWAVQGPSPQEVNFLVEDPTCFATTDEPSCPANTGWDFTSQQCFSCDESPISSRRWVLAMILSSFCNGCPHRCASPSAWQRVQLRCEHGGVLSLGNGVPAQMPISCLDCCMVAGTSMEHFHNGCAIVDKRTMLFLSRELLHWLIARWGSPLMHKTTIVSRH